MKPQDGAAELIQGQKIIIGTMATGWLSTMGMLLEYIPVILGSIVTFLSAILLMTLIWKRILEGKLLSLKVKKEEREDEEEEKKREVLSRMAQGLECRRCTDGEYADQIEEDS